MRTLTTEAGADSKIKAKISAIAAAGRYGHRKRGSLKGRSYLLPLGTEQRWGTVGVITSRFHYSVPVIAPSRSAGTHGHFRTARHDLPDDAGIFRTAAQHNAVSVDVYALVLRGGTIRRRDPVTLP